LLALHISESYATFIEVVAFWVVMLCTDSDVEDLAAVKMEAIGSSKT
jgi:hypothetical protein